MAMLEVKDLHVYYGMIHAIKGVSFEVNEGEIIALIKKLEAKGLVTRMRSTTDERRLDIGPTDEGQALKQRAASVPLAMGKCAGLDLDETVQLSTLLHKVLANVRAS